MNATARATSQVPNDAIDYDALYADYLASLVDTLRGFSARVAGLELWVPDEDVLVSLENLLDASAAVGRRNIAIELGPASAPRVDPDALLSMAARFGNARVAPTKAGLLLVVDELCAASETIAQKTAVRDQGYVAASLQNAVAPVQIPAGHADAVYAEALAEEGSRDINEAQGSLEGCIAVRHEVGEVALELVVDLEGHCIRSAAATGATNQRDQALLAAFCRLIERLPILEASDHGVARLERRLRDREAPPPVGGIILPDAAHPMFSLPTSLIRGTLARYRQLTGYAEIANEYDDRPGPHWMNAPLAERAALVASALAEVTARWGVRATDVALSSIRYNVRVELTLSPACDGLDKQRFVMEIEDTLKSRIDPRLEVYVEERKDKNTIRRLAVVGGRG